MKDKDDIPFTSGDNWFTYFHSLHSKSPFGPIQQLIMNDLNLLELEKNFRLLDHRNEIFIAAKKLQNNKSAFSDNERQK